MWSNVVDLHRSADQCVSLMPIEMAHVLDMNTFRVGFWLWFPLKQSFCVPFNLELWNYSMLALPLAMPIMLPLAIFPLMKELLVCPWLSDIHQ